ncbi:right-handed parallel beta-helix repeat-containing protein [Zavarzinia sp. CC-PAN008]|uniref:right-handed parallel beta-helix repeat-containing protein n=1 Tax=Zavarzinia sp. CC-PAN008 TaxID=3243332 RepID=UPI003F743F9D
MPSRSTSARRLAVGGLLLALAAAPALAQEAQPTPDAVQALVASAGSEGDLEKRLDLLFQALSAYDELRTSDQAAMPAVEEQAAAAALAVLDDAQAFARLAEGDRERLAPLIARLPDPVRRVDRYVVLAQRQLDQGAADGAVDTLSEAAANLAMVEGAADRDRLAQTIIEHAIRSTATGRQRAWLLARDLADPALRGQLLRAVSSAQVMAGEAAPELREVLAGDPSPSRDAALALVTQFYTTAKRHDLALAAALGVGDDNAARRDALLLAILTDQVQRRADPELILAPYVMADPAARDRGFEMLALAAVERRRISIARRAALEIAQDAGAARAWAAIAGYLGAQNYALQMADAVARAEASAARVTDAATRSLLARDIGLAALQGGDLTTARRALADATGAEQVALLTQLALAQAAQDRPQDARETIDLIAEPAARDAALVGLATAFAARGEVPEAERVRAQVRDPARQALATVPIALRRAREQGAGAALPLLRPLVGVAGQASDPVVADTLRLGLAGALAMLGDTAAADGLATAIADPALKIQAVARIAAAEAAQGQTDAAQARIAAEQDPERRAVIAQQVAQAMGEAGAFREALAVADRITDWRRRGSAMRSIAEDHARARDVYDLFQRDADPQPAVMAAAEATRPPVAQTDSYAVHRLPISTLGDTVPALPPLKRYTDSAIRALVPPVDPGKVHVVPLIYDTYNEKFVSAVLYRPRPEDESAVLLAPDERFPRYVYLESGTFDLPGVARQLEAQGRADLLAQVGKVYTLRAPLLIGPRASLVVSGADVAELRMDTNAGSYVVNAGKLYVADTVLRSWDAAAQATSLLTYETRRTFRPFLTTWSGSELYITGTHVDGLGYANGKAYGLSYSAGPKQIVQPRGGYARRPTGAVVDSLIEHNYYGFYSYEADDVAVVGTELAHNLVYGIDPHDRSRRLIFAYNTARANEHKHGIIISREVDDSFIVGNVSYGNGGSGIMIDRTSVNTLVYANLVFDNKADGITLYESACNLVAGNVVEDNGREGIKLRNSWDVALFRNVVRRNSGSGVNAYVAVLEQSSAAETRDFALDPYVRHGSSVMIGNDFADNGKGGISSNGFSWLALRGNRVEGAGNRTLAGDFKHAVGSAVADSPTGVALALNCAAPPPPATCALRAGGVFAGDALASILAAQTMPGPACTAQEAPAAAPDTLEDADPAGAEVGPDAADAGTGGEVLPEDTAALPDLDEALGDDTTAALPEPPLNEATHTATAHSSTLPAFGVIE